MTFTISDVPGDLPEVIASGPTVSDTTTYDEALAIIARYKVDIPATVATWLTSSEAETIKPGDPRLAQTPFTLIATPQDALEAAAANAKKHGISPLILGDSIEGESREVAKVHAGIA